MSDFEFLPEDHQPYPVTCARCGALGSSEGFILEEGDEWECPPCNERENRQERAEVKS